MRLASASEVPGLNISDITSEPSLKAGRKARGMKGTVAAASATATAAAASIALARGNDQSRIPVSTRLSRATNGLSGWSSRFIRGNR
ncbi:hypothetical protein D3C72_2291730 [compost metagenome]